MPTLQTRTVTPWFSYTSEISPLLPAQRQFTPIVPFNGGHQVLQVPRRCIPLQCSFTPSSFPPSQRHHANIPVEPPNRVLHTPVAAILRLNLIPLMINNQSTTDHSMHPLNPDPSSHTVPFDFLVDLRGSCFIQHRPAASPSLLRLSIPTSRTSTLQLQKLPSVP